MAPVVLKKKIKDAANRYARMCHRELAHKCSQKELLKWKKATREWRLKPIGQAPEHPQSKRLRNVP
jgi:hypothetical protein